MRFFNLFRKKKKDNDIVVDVEVTEKPKVVDDEFQESMQKAMDEHRNEVKRKMRAVSELLQEMARSDMVTVENQMQLPKSDILDKVWERHRGECVVCGYKGYYMSFGHIVPFSEGGENTFENLNVLCESCKREKIQAL